MCHFDSFPLHSLRKASSMEVFRRARGLKLALPTCHATTHRSRQLFRLVMRQRTGATGSSYLSCDNTPEPPALPTYHATTHRSCRLFLLVTRQHAGAAGSSCLSRDNAPEPPALSTCHATTRWSRRLFLLVTRIRLTLYIVMGAGDLARGLTMLNRCVTRQRHLRSKSAPWSRPRRGRTSSCPPCSTPLGSG